jgi:hypothetical protein
MVPSRKTWLLTTLTMGLSACTPSCDCGESGPRGTGGPAAEPAKTPAQGPEHQGELEGVSHEAVLVPLDDSQTAQQLIATQTRLRALATRSVEVPLVAREQLLTLLPDYLADYVPAAGPAVGPSTADGKPVLGGLRRYRRAQQDLLLRVVDAAQAPQLFTPLANELPMQGTGSWGTQRGTLLLGHSAIVRTYASGGASAMVIVGDRLILEVRLRGTATEADLDTIVRALPLSEFAAASGVQGGAGQGGPDPLRR